MARINLLPWRQEERQRKNKEFLALAGAIAAIAVLAVLAAMMVLGTTLSNQQEANAYIENANKQLDRVSEEISTLEQQREEMLSRMKVIQDLQGQRSIPVRVWDDIARAVPQAMYLTAIKREGDVITISGAADNPNIVSQLVKNLDASQWLANSGVPNIQTDAQAYQSAVATQQANASKTERQIYPEDSYIKFTVTTQVKPEVAGAEGENAGADANAQATPAATPVTPSPAPAAQPAAPAGQATPPASTEAAPAPAATDKPAGGQ